MAALTILLIGTCDTKLSELLYVRSRILQNAENVTVTLLDTGRTPVSHPAITIPQDTLFAKYKGSASSSNTKSADLSSLSRAEVIQTMTACATACVQDLHSDSPVHGMISIGGSCGTSIASAVMRDALPFTLPKLIVSTVASGDTSHIVGESDITLMYSIVDIAGSNSILNNVLDNAAGAIAGMAKAYQLRRQREHDKDHSEQQSTEKVGTKKTRVAITMFGVTTPCVDAIRHYLTTTYGYEVYVFHATGHGGRAMERLVTSNGIDAVIDLTTTEIPDQIVGGVMAAGPARLEAAAKAGIPQVVSVGACDMVNYGPRNTVPEKFVKAGRKIYEHNASVTLVRTNVEECNQVGNFIARQLKDNCVRPELVEVVLPVGGISLISKSGGPFADEEADNTLFAAIEEGLEGSKIEVIRDGREINDESFAVAIAEKLVRLIKRHFLPLLSLASLITATPVTAAIVSVSVNVYADTSCAVPDVEGYSFTKNNQCQQFIEQEGSITTTSKNAVPERCVLQVFGDTDCQDVFAATTINGECETPLLGPVSSGKLVGC